MERMKARINSTNALGLSSSAKEVVSSWKSTVRVRFWCVDLAALPMCHLHLIRPRKRMCYDEDNALKDQDNRQGFTAAPLNAMECGRLLIKLVAKVRRHAIAQQLLHSPYVVRYTRCH